MNHQKFANYYIDNLMYLVLFNITVVFATKNPFINIQSNTTNDVFDNVTVLLHT